MDETTYERGIRVTDEEMGSIDIVRDERGNGADVLSALGPPSS